MPNHPRTKHHRGRHIRYCQGCDKRIEDGEMIVIKTQRPRVVQTRMYRTTEPLIPLYYHDLCYEDGQ